MEEMNQRSHNLLTAGLGLIAIGGLYFLMTLIFFLAASPEFGKLAAEDAETAAVMPYLPLVGLIIAIVLGGFQIVIGLFVLILGARRSKSWEKALVAGILILLASVFSLAEEISNPSMITILPISQLVLSLWILWNAVQMRRILKEGAGRKNG